MKQLALALSLALAAPALAQDADGNDTPGSWRVKHHERFEGWDSVCDELGEGEALTERCYIRYVDVFSPRPAFAALFLFITPSQGGHEVAFGIELGTRFAKGGFAITDESGAPLWTNTRLGCRTGLTCTFKGDDAADLIKQMQAGAAYSFDLTDRHGTPHKLRWPLAPFAAAFADYQAGVAARGLMTQM